MCHQFAIDLDHVSHTRALHLGAPTTRFALIPTVTVSNFVNGINGRNLGIV